MKTLVIGATGLVGENFYNKLSGQKDTIVRGTYLTDKKEGLFQLDIKDSAGLKKIYDSFRP